MLLKSKSEKLFLGDINYYHMKMFINQEKAKQNNNNNNHCENGKKAEMK